MKIDYCVLDPTGNITILVDTPVPPGSMPFIAGRLMEQEPASEQVGFLSAAPDGSFALRMAGGEFCGNASMCAAVLAAVKADETIYDTKLNVSGTCAPVPVRVEKKPDGSWTGSVIMPQPVSFEKADLPEAGRLPVVRFSGISHVILEKEMEKGTAEALARRWCSFLDADALGLLFLNREEGRLIPLVYVPAVDTLCWENSCASGTAAAGVYLSFGLKEPLRISLSQPGGSLSINVSAEGTLTLTGAVKVLRHSSLALS